MAKQNEITEEKYFSTKEACRHLGVHPTTLWRERKRKNIGYRIIAGRINYSETDLKNYLNRNVVGVETK